MYKNKCCAVSHTRSGVPRIWTDSRPKLLRIPFPAQLWSSNIKQMQELLHGAFRVTVLGLNRRTVCISVCRRQRLTANPSLLLSRWHWRCGEVQEVPHLGRLLVAAVVLKKLFLETGFRISTSNVTEQRSGD